MNILSAIVAFLLAILFVFVGLTRLNAWLIERRNPPVGSFATVNGTRMHYVHVPAPGSELPPVIFVHGASANLLDQMVPIRPLLEGKAEMLFFDRPGHGWSERGEGNETPFGQAKTIAALMDHAGIERAIVVGHSFGGGTAAAFALAYPERTAGLVFVAAATHPWAGAATSWYYKLTARPWIGRLFAETIAGPAGALRMAAATNCVFTPNAVPDDYLHRAGIELVLRPSAFRANAIDVQGLHAHVTQAQPRYREISAPTVVISGDYDTVVYEELHSIGLARDIPGAELVWIKNLGHKPDWIAADLVAAAIAKVGGQGGDLQGLARTVEARIAGDRQGVDTCFNEKAPPETLLAQ